MKLSIILPVYNVAKFIPDCLDSLLCQDLDKKDQYEMLDAMLDYVFRNKKPKLKGIKKTIWTIIEPNLNTSKNRSNDNSGAPKGNKNACNRSGI